MEGVVKLPEESVNPPYRINFGAGKAFPPMVGENTINVVWRHNGFTISDEMCEGRWPVRSGGRK